MHAICLSVCYVRVMIIFLLIIVARYIVLNCNWPIWNRHNKISVKLNLNNIENGIVKIHFLFFRYLLCKKQRRNRCSTCTGQQATSMSLVSTKRQQSINRKPTMSIKRRMLNNGQETSITLLGNGHGDSHICNKIIWGTLERSRETLLETDEF